MAGNDRTPMEYMVDFFAGILGYFTDFVEQVVKKAWKDRNDRKKFAPINDKGQSIPKNVHDKMAYNNMDISNEWARKWSKDDLDKYTKEWNALPEDEKQRRRDAFHEENIDAIKYAAKEYEQYSHKKLRDVDSYFKQDRQNQPIYQQRLQEANAQDNKQTNSQNSQPSEVKQQENQKTDEKQENLEQNLSKQSSTERQKDEIQSDQLSGKASVEKANEQKEEARQSFQGRKREFDAQSQKRLNKEIFGLQSESNSVDLFSDANTAQKDKNLSAQKQQKQELEMRSEANSRDLFGPGNEVQRNQKKELEQKPERNKADLFDPDSPEHEKFREKVEKGAQKRKESAAKNSAAQKVNETTQVKDNDVAMVPNKP